MDRRRLYLPIIMLALAMLLSISCRRSPSPAPTSIPPLAVPTLATANQEATAPQPTAETPPNNASATGEPHQLGTSPEDQPTSVSDLIPVTNGGAVSCVPGKEGWMVYHVKGGDTLYRIAQQTESNVAALVSVNCLQSPDSLAIGQSLFVPREPLPLPTIVPPPSDEEEATIEVRLFEVTPNRQISYDENVVIKWDIRNADNITIWTNNVAWSYLDPQGEMIIRASELTNGPAVFDLTMVAEDFDNYLNSIQTVWQLSLDSEVKINQLAATPAVVDAYGTATIAWEFEGTTTGLLQWDPYAQGFETAAAILEPAGSITLQLPPIYRAFPIRLELLDSNGLFITQEIWLNLDCPLTYFISDPARQAGTCPLAEAASVTGAFQPFENGFMTWASDTDEILVFYENGIVESYPDLWEGEPLIVEVPPAGLFTPENGFGLLWSSYPEVRAALGWATAEEDGYEMRKQQINIYYYNQSIGARYLQLLDGRIVVYYMDNFNPNLWQYLE